MTKTETPEREVIRDQVIDELVDERVVANRERERLEHEAAAVESHRLATLTGHQEAAVTALKERETTLSAFVKKLTEVLDLAEKLLNARQAFMVANTGATKAGGTLTVSYPFPVFGMQPEERHLMERARSVLGSVGGRV